MKKIIFSILFFSLLIKIEAQQTPAEAQTKAISIEGATAHLGNGKVIENSLIMFNDGKITFVGSAMLKIARQGTIINAKGKHVYPGFIAVNSTLGLVEIDAVKASDDQREIGVNNPHIRSLIAYNAESKIVESMRPNGVLMAQITPRGGTISGTSSIVQLDAWNWEDAALKVDDGIHINWPGSFTSGRWWLGEDPALKADPKYENKIHKIKEYFVNARLYSNGKKENKNLPFEALEALFNGDKKLFIHIDGQKEITDAILMFKSIGIDNLVIVNGARS